jgi:hypothetical protein
VIKRLAVAGVVLAVAVRLIDAGHRLIEATVRSLLEHEADLISALTGTERATLTSLLATLEQALATTGEGGWPPG